MHGDRESRERGDGPVVESVAQSVRHGGQRWSGTLAPEPQDERQDERGGDDRDHGEPGQRTSG